MKIAITADPELPVPPVLYGGIERVIFMLITELVKSGHNVTLFAHKDSNVPCRLIPYKSTSNNLGGTIINCFTINKVLFSQKFDIIHSFGRLAYLLPQLPLKIPKLMSYQREPTLNQIKKAVKIAAKNTLAFTGCSNYITDKIKCFAEAYTVYNGVDTLKYNASTTVPDDAPLVFLGRIEPIKGAHIAIEIALKTNKKLVIAGNIPTNHENYFNDKIKPFINKNITYIGAVNDQQKNELLSNSLALLMPICWDEPFGIVMIEAMACGTPVVGFNKGAVAEVVENGITGYCTNDFNILVEKINQVHLLNRKRIREITEIRFSSKVIVDEYLKIYHHLLINK